LSSNNPNPSPDSRASVLECLVRRTLQPAINPRLVYGERPSPVEAATYFILDLAAGLSSHPLVGQGLQGVETLQIPRKLDLSELEGVDPFIHHTLGRLLLQLSHSTVQKQETFHAQVRGRINWSATYKARYGEEYNPTLYVCAQVQHLYETPENQLVKYLVEHIEAALKSIPPEMRCGMCYLPENRMKSYEDIGRRIETLETAIHRLKRSVRLRSIATPDQIGERHLLRAETARVEEYADAARLYRRYRRLVLQTSWKSLAEVTRHGLPLPGELNDNSRRWVHLAADLYKMRINNLNA
jgi:hypothetical protein